MKITDSAYITSMRDVVMQPALLAMEAAMLPAKQPRHMGALAHIRAKEALRWRGTVFTGRRSGSGKHVPWR